jgi:hypothetical protein
MTWLLTELDPKDPDRAFGLDDRSKNFPELCYERPSCFSGLKSAFLDGQRVPERTVRSAGSGRCRSELSVHPPGSCDAHRERTIRRSVRNCSSARDSDFPPGAGGPVVPPRPDRARWNRTCGSISSVPGQTATATLLRLGPDVARGGGRHTAQRGGGPRRCRDACMFAVES